MSKQSDQPKHGLRILLIILAALFSGAVLWCVLQFLSARIGNNFWSELIEKNGFWTLLALIISSPVAFFIWLFRDQNTIKQLESQRKDVNLKEFHKIAEWVSGLHLVEDKITKKTKESPRKLINKTVSLETENIQEYGQAGNQRHLPSHSREDGAVGLQVAAVYMLKPFFCGEHGDGFRRPALNLLTAAWLALFKQVEGKENQDEELEHVRNSPLAIALTEVLLAEGGKHLRCHKEVFSNLYLSYINLHLLGLSKEVLELFKETDCTGIQLQGAKLQRVELQEIKLTKANLQGANLQGANLTEANLYKVNLQDANLEGAELQEVNLQESNLYKADLLGANLQGANLTEANLEEAELFGATLQKATLSKTKLQKSNLEETDLQNANLSQAKLEKAYLRSAHLQKASLLLANLQEADLQEADLEEADLRFANLQEANLQEANFKGVKLGKTNLKGANLQDIKALELEISKLNDITWTGALLMQQTVENIENKTTLTNIDWIIIPESLKEILDCHSTKKVEFQFKKISSDESVQHILGFKSELPIEKKEIRIKLLAHLQELNSNWTIKIITIQKLNPDWTIETTIINDSF
ncbi:pentapeptide repeat-containing protein [Neisseria zalophi]|uniref:Pentapeptide repeat-containing protein n=1 Tax=Neisseria zalophi TaxID=640030 RepID=A0A5J6PX76_9NEIS|nr:pentapeptide repeat-containing protein [Neisseria zalophi]QEY25457.1 pentapeptide repeat-containing protein [Neisseria zalophi]